MTSDRNPHPTVTDIISRPWKVIPNDLIGGWCIVLRTEDRKLHEGALDFADVMSEHIANHMVRLHNRWVAEKHGPAKPRLTIINLPGAGQSEHDAAGHLGDGDKGVAASSEDQPFA